ncbi:hypothetical protein GCG54_00015409 [Colletotrichum gloeosporioides]|uniref:Uncharacterized protein n=1 Tax=Colletotrichum gloeosporioides TaxID=474922 RepID=A0A8H4FM06_COLGL|nr:uncharacterized protein GCG54_00015409 [Colletotrichum gloeosporioides]KAF3805849.1 hypothetical protein GCG54_00015409 [Colletotrichum gloeosporioides]
MEMVLREAHEESSVAPLMRTNRAAGNLTYLNVSVDSGPTRDESDSDMDSEWDGNSGDDTGLSRGIPTLQPASLIFAKNRQGEGLTPRAVLQALAQSQDLREAELKDVVLGQRILVARTHSEVNKFPYLSRLERLEIKPADAMAIEEVARISSRQLFSPHMGPNIVGQPERPRPSHDTQDYE